MAVMAVSRGLERTESFWLWNLLYAIYISVKLPSIQFQLELTH